MLVNAIFFSEITGDTLPKIPCSWDFPFSLKPFEPLPLAGLFLAAIIARHFLAD